MTAIQQFLAEAPRFYTYWNMLFLGQAALNTILVSLIGCLIGYLIGFVVATLRLAAIMPAAPVRGLLITLVEAIRRIPFLVLLMCVFFGFQLSGANQSLFVIAVTAVALRMSALAAENIRAGYEAVHQRQWEAAAALNIPPIQALFRIILPQAWRIILPPSTIHTVSMIKETSLVSQIGFLELTFAARALNQRGFSALICFGTILVAYFVISWSFAQVGRRLEKKLVHEARGVGRGGAAR
ncbi:amino acid ABC transporter permease [Phreatobacter oligotrophus]|jgi:polar amino acid transport system permease protein|uniref:amino acid ABC transporter permease n=1 Tax=Phreatobacter oligotrophus TaxID=1122261 RepID=UPI0023574A21|nr:amino acid ABC transporter permease [Phreatobacter oligotrophus]MBX9989491.1 amino acid ABC transporter permease [Phreatobacter oligotrophus]